MDCRTRLQAIWAVLPTRPGHVGTGFGIDVPTMTPMLEHASSTTCSYVWVWYSYKSLLRVGVVFQQESCATEGQPLPSQRRINGDCYYTIILSLLYYYTSEGSDNADRLTRATAPYVSWGLTCPGALRVVGTYVSWGLTCPGALHILGPYVSWGLTCRGDAS